MQLLVQQAIVAAGKVPHPAGFEVPGVQLPQIAEIMDYL